jgi:hypothetical protein
MTEIEQLRTEVATLRDQLEHLEQCHAALDAFADAAGAAMMELISAFEDDPATHRRVTEAVSTFAGYLGGVATKAFAGLPKTVPN